MFESAIITTPDVGLGVPQFAGVAQLVESQLPKLVVAGSNPVARSIFDGCHWEDWA